MAKAPTSSIPEGAERVDAGDDQGGSGGLANENGFTPEEQAAWDQMEAATDADMPAGDESRVPPAEADAGDAPADGDDDDVDAGSGKEREPVAPEERGKRVSMSRYNREIKQREETLAARDKELNDIRLENARISERMRLFNEAVTAASKQPQAAAPAAAAAQQAAAQQDAAGTLPTRDADPMPDPDENLFEFAKWQGRENQRLANELQEMRQGVTQRFQTQDQQTEQNTLTRTFHQDAAAFASKPETADFGDAYNYLKQTRLGEIGEMLFGKDIFDEKTPPNEEEAKAIIDVFNGEEKWLVQKAVERKQSPSASIYRLAKSRGYVKRDAAAAAPAVAGRAAPAAAPRPTSVVEQVQQLRQNVQDGRSLSDGGGADGIPDSKTPNDVGLMTEAQFEEFLATAPLSEINRIMGDMQQRQ